jgi:glutamate dehydrogenase
MIPQVAVDRRDELVAAIREALADVGTAVADYPAMKALLADTIARLEADANGAGERQAEEVAFLKWLASDHFVLLGTRNYRYPLSSNGELAIDEPLYGPEDGLGILRDPARTILRRLHEPSMLTPQLREQVESDEGIVVAKSNFRSRVHRRVYCDYVGVKLRGDDGRVEGEVRFLGLFTAEAYDEPATQVPLVRRKVRRVLESLAETNNGASAKRLRNVIANYPRDELFQMREGELRETALGVAQLQDRPRVRLFVRHDPFQRFVSVLLFVPRERYDSDFRERAGAAIAEAFGGHVSAFYPFFGDTPLARVHFIIGVKPGEGRPADVALLEADVAALSRTWEDRFEETARANEAVVGETERLVAEWRGAFSAGYQEL